MSSDHFRSSLLGLRLRAPPTRRSHGGALYFARAKSTSGPPGSPFCAGSCLLAPPLFGPRFAAAFPLRNLGSRRRQRHLKVSCIKDSFSRSRAFVRSLSPFWQEGLLFIRCSIFFVVISATALLVWYGQFKTRNFVENRLLPSVCSILSEYVQREFNFGKLRSISPLGITLQSCSIGPHPEEFSCGELPMMKLRVRPFASLRRGKIVIDAVLSQPNILIAQKEDFSWLGIPSHSEDGLKRYSSSEEGIDYRTKIRRFAREETAAKWYRERTEAAKKAAQEGYIVPQNLSTAPSAGAVKRGPSLPIEDVTSGLFIGAGPMGDESHWRDHPTVDMGLEYAMKHEELEKSFGVGIRSKDFKFWPTMIRSSSKGKVKQENSKKVTTEADITYKQRNLERSAAAALAYFRGLDGGKFDGSSVQLGSTSVCGDDTDEKLTLASSKGDGADPHNNSFLSIVEYHSSEDVLKSVLPESKSKKHAVEISLENNAAGHGSEDKGTIESCIDNLKNTGYSEGQHHINDLCNDQQLMGFNTPSQQPHIITDEINDARFPVENLRLECGAGKKNLTDSRKLSDSNMQKGETTSTYINNQTVYSEVSSKMEPSSQSVASRFDSYFIFDRLKHLISLCFLNLQSRVWFLSNFIESLDAYLSDQILKLKSYTSVRADDLTSEITDEMDLIHDEGIKKPLPIVLDSVYFTEGTLMLLGFGDQEPREMDHVNGHVKFQNHFTRVHVQLSGNCREWRSNLFGEDGGQLSVNVFVDTVNEKWHANLKVVDLFTPLFERILELPVSWFKGRASGEVHICMSGGETFPNLHGQLDVRGLAFQFLDAPSRFSDVTANLCFRGQRIFLHNANGKFGDAPLEASGDFGINPEDGEFHLMCQVPCVEINSLMKTLKMKPLLFSLAGSVTAVFNCQGPLDAPIFVGSGIVSRKTPNYVPNLPPSPASEAVTKNKEGGAVAAFDHIPFTHVSANFTFNTDNSVADLYGMRATLLDGGEIRGAGNAWICPEGELDDSAIDVNLSGNFSFDKVFCRYFPSIQLVPLKIGELNGETKLSGSLLKPRFDIKWAAPKAEDSFSDARGDIIICHEHITVNSSSVAFDLYTKLQTTYFDESCHDENTYSGYRKNLPLKVDGVDLDLRMRGFEFSSLFFSNPFDAPRPIHLKATGKVKIFGKVVKIASSDGRESGMGKNVPDIRPAENEVSSAFVGDVSLSGIKLNQLMLAPQLAGSVSISRHKIKLDATGRPDENMSVEVVGPILPTAEELLQNKTLLSVALQKGQLKANIYYQPHNLANLEVRNLPLDELELASLRGTIQRAELQLNFQKRRGHGLLSVLHPKFSGVLGEALNVAARWSGDVITVEKTILEQAFSHYELQGEYVLPGTRDRYPSYSERDGLLKKALDGNLGSLITSMGRWRMRLEVPRAEVSEMLPLARLLSRSIDPSVHSKSKDIFIQCIQSMGFYAESFRELLEAIQNERSWSDDVVVEEVALPGLAELKGRWRGSLDASGGGDGDTMAEFDFHGEDWEWGSYRTQKVLALGAYSNNSGLRLDNMFIQKDNATLHADGTVLGPITNLHFAVLNFPVDLVPRLAQIVESSATEFMESLRRLISPVKGILHMEGDLRGSLLKPECDVQVRLLDGAVGGIDLGRAEVVASITPTSRLLFHANFEPAIQSGHVHVQGNVPVTYIQDDSLEEDSKQNDLGEALNTSVWLKENVRGSIEENEKNMARDRAEDGWNVQLAESLEGLNWSILDVGEVRIDADIKDGGMMLLTALCPYANWLHGYADINLQVRGTVEQPVLDGSASFHRASVSSPVLQKPLTNFGGNIYVKSNRLSIISMESRVSRKGKILVKGSLPLKASESYESDRIDLKCEVLEVRAKNIFSGQVDTQMQITGSILQPNISGKIKLSHGEAYLPHDKGNGEAINRLASKRSSLASGTFNRFTSSGHVSQFFGSETASSRNQLPQQSGNKEEIEKIKDQTSDHPVIDVRLTDLRVFLGPELRIVYPLILNFAASGELELNGIAHPKLIKPKGVLTFENGDVNLVATQVRLKRDHLNVAKFEPDLGLDPTLDLALVGSEWQFRIQGPASKWQDNLVVTSTRSVDQDVLSPSEAAKVFESQLAESLLESDGKLAFKKLATATLETLMPRIEGKGEFGQARWRLVYAPQIPSLLSVDPTIDPLKSLANNISFGTEVEVQLGKRLQASIVRQMKDSEMAMQWTLIYQLTSRLRVLFQSSPSTRLLFEYSATSQD